MSTTSPCRIQRKRTKGWRMPENTVFVGRPTKWGNPFRVDGRRVVWSGASIEKDTPEEAQRAAVRLYRAYLDNDGSQAGAIRDEGGAFLKQLAPEELRGMNLACWCPDHLPCHADILLEIANQ